MIKISFINFKLELLLDNLCIILSPLLFFSKKLYNSFESCHQSETCPTYHTQLKPKNEIHSPTS